MNVTPDTPVLRFIYWLVNTPGLGGLGVGAIIATCLAGLTATLRWISRGAQAAEAATYAFPSPALLDHEQSHPITQ